MTDDETKAGLASGFVAGLIDFAAADNLISDVPRLTRFFAAGERSYSLPDNS